MYIVLLCTCTKAIVMSCVCQSSIKKLLNFKLQVNRVVMVVKVSISNNMLLLHQVCCTFDDDLVVTWFSVR